MATTNKACIQPPVNYSPVPPIPFSFTAGEHYPICVGYGDLQLRSAGNVAVVSTGQQLPQYRGSGELHLASAVHGGGGYSQVAGGGVMVDGVSSTPRFYSAFASVPQVPGPLIQATVQASNFHSSPSSSGQMHQQPICSSGLLQYNSLVLPHPQYQSMFSGQYHSPFGVGGNFVQQVQPPVNFQGAFDQNYCPRLPPVGTFDGKPMEYQNNDPKQMKNIYWHKPSDEKIRLTTSEAQMYNHLQTQDVMDGRVSYQELLRGVSTFQQQTIEPRMQQCYAENKICEGDVGVNGNIGKGCQTQGSDSDDEEETEYPDADDEDSEENIEEDTTVATIELNQTNESTLENRLEFEFVPITSGQTLTFKTRRRFPKDYEVPDFREPRDIGAIEKAMRIGRVSPKGHIFEPKIGMVFDSRIEAYKFYNLYSWEVGFGVRFGSFSQNRVNKMRTMQKIVCERQGFDSRVQSKSKRCRCKAMLVLHRTEDIGWYVSRHVTDHNHELSITCGEKREWNSHSKIQTPARNMIKFLRENNVSLTRVHCFMGSMYGGMDKIPFNPKSTRNVCSELARENKDGDMAKTLEVFRKLRQNDPGFQFCVDVDGDKKVKTLMWATGKARSQYAFFGDAITFDTTYCTNIYNMPFGIFVGVNNHFQSIFFAGVLMKHEDTASFKWVFKEFITLMGGKAPVTILTDQCKAMGKAIEEVYSAYTVHLWCKWHVLRYAPQEIGPLYRENHEFRKEFHFIINEMLTIDEFEKGWEYLVNQYGLQDSKFMKKTYAKRAKWAKPWARGTFCARMASTQRSESANSVLKKVVPPHSCMNRFVQQYKKLEFLRTTAEQEAEHQTKQFIHCTRRMYAIEEHAISVYTKNCFKLFSEEVDKSTRYMVREGEEEGMYLVIHNNPAKRKGWARVIYNVTVDEGSDRYMCECGQYEHFGILCYHALKVMIHKGLQKIPDAHILKRWTRNARDFVYAEEVGRNRDEELGQNMMFANALDVVNSTENNPKAEEILMRHLTNAKREIADVKKIPSNKLQVIDGYSTAGTTDIGFSETDGAADTGYESNGQLTLGNTYGASGCSAYMSDADIMNIQAPAVPGKNGRPRVKRMKPMFARKRRGMKKYRASTDYTEAMQ